MLNAYLFMTHITSAVKYHQWSMNSDVPYKIILYLTKYKIFYDREHEQ